MWQYRSVFDHLLRLLATSPGPENAAQALRLVSSAEVADRRHWTVTQLRYWLPVTRRRIWRWHLLTAYRKSSESVWFTN
ncbi:DUF6183 family protein [Streptomyces sp. NPDC056534]|uniref:DUF6183 family protein n=1 Tax=Streptomyces sp. NPDC056534 TaxID=3345857 RepID=UPI00369F451D